MNCNSELDIPGFSRYTIDYYGTIRSKSYKNTGRKRKLKPALDACGYLRTMLLGDDGKYHTVKVHRISALAFHGESNLDVNHKDGIKTNNYWSNLEYVSKSENTLHAYRTGLLKPKKGVQNGNSKLNDNAVKDIREVARRGGRYYGRKALAEKYGVSESHIKHIVNNKKLWSHV